MPTRVALLLLIAWSVSPIVPPHAGALSFAVTDASFVGGVYEFRFRSDPGEATLINGVDQGVAAPFLTNAGWVCCRDDGPRFWHAQGPPFGSAELTSGALTMGWNLSGVTGQIAKVEVNPNQYLFQFAPWTAHAVGDTITGSVATPATFGTGAYTQIHSFAGNNTVATLGQGTLQDITGFLPAPWLLDPGLLELRYAYAQTPSPTIPAAHLQLFRDITGGVPSGVSGFTLRLTLAPTVEPVPEPATLAPVAGALVVLALVGRRRRSAVRG